SSAPSPSNPPSTGSNPAPSQPTPTIPVSSQPVSISATGSGSGGCSVARHDQGPNSFLSLLCLAALALLIRRVN
ncbi:MAG: JDVT-CTERM domain-containing protein, partial [Planctomycetota bacterium]|nr:JDVT-CTERM domain-containing protein [Planctomycetota bacterium]